MISRIPELLDDYLAGDHVERRARLAAMLPRRVLPALRRDKFRRLIRYVADRSPFYRRRFKEAGIDARRIRDPRDLGDFFTTAQDLRDHPVEEFLCDRP